MHTYIPITIAITHKLKTIQEPHIFGLPFDWTINGWFSQRIIECSLVAIFMRLTKWRNISCCLFTKFVISVVIKMVPVSIARFVVLHFKLDDALSFDSKHLWWKLDFLGLFLGLGEDGNYCTCGLLMLISLDRNFLLWAISRYWLAFTFHHWLEVAASQA